MSVEDMDVAEEASVASAVMKPGARPHQTGHTRTSGAWASIALGLAALVVVLVFAIQNLRTVEITFLSLHWAPPLAVLVLLASAFGGLVVLAFGVARIGQLRVQARRFRRRAAATRS